MIKLFHLFAHCNVGEHSEYTLPLPRRSCGTTAVCRATSGERVEAGEGRCLFECKSELTSACAGRETCHAQRKELPDTWNVVQDRVR